MNARGRAASRVSRLARAEAPVVRRVTPTPVVAVPRRTLDIPADIAEQLAAGKLSQRCDACGTTEAAGFTCTSCDRKTGPSDWFRPEASAASREALTIARAKRRKEALRGSALEKTANPGLLAGHAESLTLGF